MRIFELHPYARLAAAVSAAAAVLLARSSTQLMALWLILCCLMLTIPGLLRIHLRFLMAIVFPLALALSFVWAGIIGAPPGSAPHSSPKNGLAYAILIVARLAVLGTLMQLTFLTVPREELPALFAAWGVRGPLYVAIVGSLSLVNDVKLRASQVFTARCARGLMRTRSPFNRAKQIAPMLRALVTWIVRSAVDRAQMWEHRNLLADVDVEMQMQSFRTWDYLILIPPLLLLVYNAMALVRQ